MPKGIQYFRDDADGLAFSKFAIEWIERYRENRNELLSSVGGSSYGLGLLTENAKLELLARYIHSQSWIPLCEYVSADFFATNFLDIIDIYENIGSFYSLSKAASLLSNGGIPAFDYSEAGKIGISITAQTAISDFYVTDNSVPDSKALGVESVGASSALTVNSSTAELTPYEITVILQGMQINGVQISVTF
jgi:hypothetical protein